MSEFSCVELIKIIPHLKELTISNLTKGGSRRQLIRIIETCQTEGHILEKLKLSNINLSDNIIVHLICEMIQTKSFLSHLDLSWAKLGARHLDKIAFELRERHHIVRNLNLSYNSLTFEPNHADYQASEDFIDHIREYMDYSEALIHVDLSGLSLGDD